MPGGTGGASGRELLLASNNTHKHDEFIRFFPGFTILRPNDLGLAFEFEENGQSFLENALGKALALHRTAGRPVIADDSGLCVAALGGEPGIFSSRYGSTPAGGILEAPERNRYLLWRMQGVGDRRAFFVCCLVLVIEPTRFFIVQETVHGLVAEAPRGGNGFGYDPLFLLPERGKTIAELPDPEKDLVSHRGRAARRMLDIMLDILKNSSGEGIP
jgi:XTP/dITP diphosphohydrolase